MSEALGTATPDRPRTGGPRGSATSGNSLDDRYGTGRRGRIDRRFGWGAAALLVLAGVVFLLWSGWEEGGRVETQSIGFAKQGEFEVSVKFSVSAPSGAPVACAVEALSTSKAVVGWNVIELPVTEQRSHTITTRLLTTGPATAAHVRECWIVES